MLIPLTINIRVMTKASVCLAIAMLLSGCANGFTKFYQDYTANYSPAVVNARLGCGKK